MIAALVVFAAVAAIGCALVLAVYRAGDVERVARECVAAAVAQEREQVNRMLIANATSLRRNGRTKHAQVVDQLLSMLKARTAVPEVSVSALGRRKRSGLDARIRSMALAAKAGGAS